MRSSFEAGGDAVEVSGATVSNAASNGTFCPQPQRRSVLIAAILASALGFIDGSVVSIAIPAIRADLGATLADAQWISNAYALTLSALILAGGAAGDNFGLRRTFVAGIALFVAASLACAVAPGAASLILARAVQGIGAAIMVPGSLAIIAKAYPKKERGRAIGIWAAASALTTALGPVVGGLVLSAFDDSVWRVIFAINLPLGGVAVYLLLAKVPADRPAEKRKLDLGGAAIASIGLGALAYGLTALSAEGAESSTGRSLASIVAGLGVFAGFIFWERRQRYPMVDLSLFRTGAFTGANVATFFLYFALSGILFYLPMLLIAGWGLSEAETGLIFLPLSAAIALLSGPVGKLSDRIGPRLPIAAGSLIVAAAFAGLAAAVGAGYHGFWTAIFPAMVLLGFGMALVVSPLSTAIMTAVEDNDTGAASGINNAVSRMAGLLAVAALGGVAAFRYAAVLGNTTNVPGFGEPAANLSMEIDAVRLAASDAAFSAVAWVTAGLCVLSAIVAWMTVSGVAPNFREDAKPFREIED
jgi:EmrB/QacA subfamily drug resistance transporter